MPHYVTNRGKLVLARGDWDDSAGTDWQVGLLSGGSTPAAIDTQAEANPLNFVSDLLALSGVTEVTGGWYSRKTLTRTNGTEDDVNNRVNLDAADVVWTAATAGVSIWGGFVFKVGASDAARELVSVIVFNSVVTTNGGDLTMAVADLYRVG